MRGARCSGASLFAAAAARPVLGTTPISLLTSRFFASPHFGLTVNAHPHCRLPRRRPLPASPYQEGEACAAAKAHLSRLTEGRSDLLNALEGAHALSAAASTKAALDTLASLAVRAGAWWFFGVFLGFKTSLGHRSYLC